MTCRSDFSRAGYVVASLPTLPFHRDQFDLALCSHLLLLYSQQLDFGFHLASVLELLRVAPEARLFPLLDLSAGRSAHLEPLVQMLVSRGIHCELARVPYEFQSGGNEMLIVRRV